MSVRGERKTPRQRITEGIVGSVLKEVDQKYGPDSEQSMAYHNRMHTENVLNAATMMGQFIGFSPEDMDLLRIAAAYHDIVHGKGGGINEVESSVLAASTMRQAGIYTDEEIATVERIILATTPVIADGKMRQSAEEDDLLAAVLCDADLATFGAEPEIFWARALDYERERLGKSELTEDEIKDFIKHQIKFMEAHNFYTAAARQLFPHKEDNIEWLKGQL